MGTNASQADRRKRTSGQLNYPGRAADRVRFPADFGNRFTLFIYIQQTFSKDDQVQGAGEAIAHLPEFQRMAEAHGVIPTYLLNYTMAMSGVVQDILGPIAQAGHCVIGAQLQPWLTPPFQEELIAENSYPGNLPLALERAKLESLTDAIGSYFDQRPLIYRAGRYGVGPNTAQLLSQAGYRMDVSIRPRFDYRADGGPDFRRYDARPFWAGPQHMLLALPVGATYTGLLRRAGGALQDRAQRRPSLGGALARSKALSRVALTPEDVPLADAKEAVRVMLGDGIQMLNFAMHSPSLSPGHSPYVRNSADLNAFYRWWEDMFGFLAQNNVRPIAADAIIAAAWATR